VPASRCLRPWRNSRFGSIRRVWDEVMAGSLRKD
jgi:hypothetical protein